MSRPTIPNNPDARITVAYLRVSTDQQDVDNQKHGILEYANKNGMIVTEFGEDTVSGRVDWRARQVGAMIDNLRDGDTIIFAEISRIARNTLQVLEVMKYCMEKGISIHVAKQNMVLDGSMQSRIVATVLGMCAEIDRDFISLRTKEGLAKRKAMGIKLGRPPGSAKHVKLDEKATEIRKYLKQGISKVNIARLLECSPTTLYAWLEREQKTLAKKSR